MLSGTDQSDTVSDLVSVLSKDSASALDWLGHHFGVDLSVVSRLGGHSHARTHRPKGPPPGAAIVSTLIKKLEAYPEDRLEIMKGMRMESLITSGSPQSVLGVTVSSCDTGVPRCMGRGMQGHTDLPRYPPSLT